MNTIKNNGLVLVLGGVAIGALLVGGLFFMGAFDEKPGLQVDRTGVEVNLPDQINIGKKK